MKKATNSAVAPALPLEPADQSPDSAIPAPESAPKKTAQRKSRAKPVAPEPAPEPAPQDANGADHSEEPDAIKAELKRYEVALLQAVENLINSKLTVFAANLPKAVPEERFPLVFSAVLNVMKDLEPLAKTHLHPEQEFTFRTIDELAAVLQPLFVKHGLVFAPEVLSESHENHTATIQGESFLQFFTKVTVRWHIRSLFDGSEWPDPVVTMGEAMSEVQFSTNAAQTMAFKQALWQFFMIPTQDVDDPEGVVAERSRPRQETNYFQQPESNGASAPQPTLFDETLGDDYTEVESNDPRIASVGGAKVRQKKPNAEAVSMLDQQAPPQLEPVTPGQIRMIQTHLKHRGASEEWLFGTYRVGSWANVTKDMVPTMIAGIQQYKPEQTQEG